MNKKQREAIARGLQVVDIRPSDEDKFRRPTLEGGFGIFTRTGSPPLPAHDESEPLRSDSQSPRKEWGQREGRHTSDHRREDHTSDL